MIFHTCVGLPEPPNGQFTGENPRKSIYKWMIWRYPYSRNPVTLFLYFRPRKIRWLEKAVSESMLGILQRRGYFSRINLMVTYCIIWYTLIYWSVIWMLMNFSWIPHLPGWTLFQLQRSDLKPHPAGVVGSLKQTLLTPTPSHVGVAGLFEKWSCCLGRTI